MTAAPVDTPPIGARQRVVSTHFHVCDRRSVTHWLDDQAPRARDEGVARYVCVANVTDVMDAHKDNTYAEALEASDLTVPDGKPVVWAMRSAGCPIRTNVRGADLMQSALEHPRIAPRRHVLIGGSAEARAGVRQNFPGVNWVGEIDFRFNELDDDGYRSVVAEYQRLDADYAWVSLGGGKQVRFMHRFAPMADRGVLLGVGAAFDFHAGLVKQAPGWAQRLGVEWLHRLLSEPHRLWHRYLIHNPPFLYHWLREWSSGAAAPSIDDATAPPCLARSDLRIDPPDAEAAVASKPRSASVVVPLFNEAECVDSLLQSLSRAQALLADNYRLEFILVDDGSYDLTVPLIEEAITGRPAYRLVRHSENRGIAAAIHTGISAATTDTVASIDADGSYDVSLLREMLPLVSADVPMATASPYHPHGGVDGAPAWRVSLSRAASRIYAWFMPQRMYCYTSCFRVYHRDTILQCEPRNDGFTGIAELAWKVARRGGKIAEQPAVLRARTAGVSKMQITGTMAAHARLLGRVVLASLRDRVCGPPDKTRQRAAKR